MKNGHGSGAMKRQRNVNTKTRANGDVFQESRSGGSLASGLANRETGSHPTPNSLGLDTQGPNQVPQRHPSSKAARGTRWGP